MEWQVGCNGTDFLFLIDGNAVRSNFDIQGRLLVVLVELITHDCDNDDERADDDVDDVAATHDLISLKSNSEYRQESLQDCREANQHNKDFEQIAGAAIAHEFVDDPE